MRGPTSGRRDEKGQAAVELAAVFPFLLFLLVLLFELGVVLLDQLAVAQAAREGARAAAVDPKANVAAVAAGKSTRLDPKRMSTSQAVQTDGMVHVTVRYTSEVDLPFTHQVLLRPQVEGTAAMRVEE